MDHWLRVANSSYSYSPYYWYQIQRRDFVVRVFMFCIFRHNDAKHSSN